MFFVTVTDMVYKKKTKANAKRVPDAVLRAAKDVLSQYDGTVEYLGQYKGADAYGIHFTAEDLTIGIPRVYLYKNEKVKTVTVEEIQIEDAALTTRRTKQLGDYSRYLRRQAERYAKSQGYDGKKLRKARRSDGVTLFPISDERVAVSIDEAGRTQIIPF